MPLNSLPNQGIEVPLSEYNRLRAFQGGGWFWDHDNQQVIREVLGDFLPRVEERRDRGGALFQHFVGGVEAASRSQAVGARMSRVPRAEYHRLQRALENLKLKTQDPHTDPNARRVIEKFCLPDPAKDPDLYRMYGSSWNRRLIVLWGCEREEGTSLAPINALHKIAVESRSAAFLRRLPWLLGLLLLILLVFAAGWWWQHREIRKPGQPTANIAAAAQPVVPDRQETANFQPGEAKAPARLPALPPSASDAQASPNSFANTITRDLSASAKEAAATQTAQRSAREHSAPLSSSPNDDPASHSTVDRTKNAASTTVSEKSALSSSDAKQAAKPPSSANEAANSSRNGASATASASPTSDPRSASMPSGTPGQTGSPGLSTGNQNTPPATDAAGTAPSASPKLEIFKAQSSSTPHDGKMDTVLMATAHEADGTAAPLQITRWSVDGRPQHDRAGREVTTGQLDLSLPPGKHRVGVTGTARGLPVEYETDLDVQIKSQGDVTLKPRDTK